MYIYAISTGMCDQVTKIKKVKRSAALMDSLHPGIVSGTVYSNLKVMYVCIDVCICILMYVCILCNVFQLAL